MMDCGCGDGVCMKCHGVKKLVLGALVLAWALLLPSLDWRLVLGGLLVLAGVLKLVKPMCGHCAMPDKKKK
ncbi:MAG: hypothetical protein A2822_04965 [Candidatus Staskawiczbacteria bacterium RIFCSPHIGHO2_01_FULL_41_41]|uniref:Uncharacterized protein n=1 Tax=Candidatus Staskawiczbacteria bacterium RIFCSPHIGHO2_01_FULL_41_41 TaxID=1802203 RepID=A0A1G2HU03_9BACT|nr:MAG: hypothetical protein A2822_04965 [Candidatus Staskawiczbacteria bacterium RIFCSPHIGHO2_01_FULL_41_41]